jgi:hypothetical protein
LKLQAKLALSRHHPSASLTADRRERPLFLQGREEELSSSNQMIGCQNKRINVIRTISGYEKLQCIYFNCIGTCEALQARIPGALSPSFDPPVPFLISGVVAMLGEVKKNLN